jgi:protein-S-isoprenylcysteine O-methyltransferase Ste14
MTDPTQAPPARSGSPGAAVLGGALIVLGLIFFASQQLNIDIGQAAWPFYVIAPGLALATLGLTQRRGSGLTIAGSVVTMVGLVLLYQNATDRFESWAYAWALVGPGGSGIGMLLYGTRSGDRKMARDGFWTILTAIGLFAVGLVFFEGIIGISGERLPLPNWVLPVAVIVIGVLVLLRGLTFRGQVGRDWGGADWHGGTQGETGSPVPSGPDGAGTQPESVAAAVEEPREDA